MTIIYGTDENDLLQGSDDKDTIYGNGGDDSIVGGLGWDIIWGWLGNDTISGGDGNDLIGGDDGNDLIRGDNDDDSIFGWEGNDTLYGGAGHDLLMGEQGTDFLYGDAGNDTIFAWIGNDWLYGGEGNDFLGGDQGDDRLFGYKGNDSLFGWTGNDDIQGEDGDDLLSGEDGNDTLSGGLGADSLHGGVGNDLIYVDFRDSNHYWGGAGNDTYSIQSHPAEYYENLVHDFVKGEDKIDVRALGITGIGSGPKELTIEGSNIYSLSKLLLTATNGVTFDASDFIFVPAVPVVDGIILVSNDSELKGTNKDDILTAKRVMFNNGTLAPVDQRIHGYDGDDTITGGAGSDTLSGGSGNDTFVFSPIAERHDHLFTPDMGRSVSADGSTMPNYRDVITDFTIGEDTLSFGNLWDLGAPSIFNNREVAPLLSQAFTVEKAQAMIDAAQDTTYEGKNAVVLDIYGPDRSTITLVGLSASDLTLDMFGFE